MGCSWAREMWGMCFGLSRRVVYADMAVGEVHRLGALGVVFSMVV